jgi:hypothetical protein
MYAYGTVVFLSSLDWLIMSAPKGGVKELLASCSGESAFKWKFFGKELFYW